MICYEIISSFIQSSSNDTNLIINISEDGWFETLLVLTSILLKLFLTIESNTFVLRSANEGAYDDNKGEVIKNLILMKLEIFTMSSFDKRK